MARYAFIKQGEVKAILECEPRFILNSSFDPGCEMQILGDVIPKVGDMQVGAGYVTPQKIEEK